MRPYRLKISNLPPKVTRATLVKWLELPDDFAQYIKLPPGDEHTRENTSVYLINQASEYKLRKIIFSIYNKPTSYDTKNILCQIEKNQEFFDWDDEKSEPSKKIETKNHGPKKIEPPSNVWKFPAALPTTKESRSVASIPRQSGECSCKYSSSNPT